MACDLTLGRKEPCKDSVGGVDKVYFINYDDAFLAKMTFGTAGESDVITAVTGTPNAYEYEVKNATSFTQNIQSSRDTGTTHFEQVLEITFKKLTQADHKEIKIMSWGRPHVIIKDNNGNFFLAGLEHGMDVTGGTIVTGGAFGDLSGYTLTLTGMEKIPAPFLDNGMTGFTIVPAV